MVTDRHLEKDSEVAKKEFVVSKQDIGTGLTDFELGEKAPGKDYIIEAVKVYCTATAATASVDAKVAGTSVLQSEVTPSANSVVEGTLVSDQEARHGAADDAITVDATTDGTGTITDLRVEVVYRIRR